MRYQVTIEHLLLPQTKSVTLYDGLGKGSVVTYHAKDDDAEYQLLAAAIDRFATVMELRAKEKEAS
ncbi:hypothetical protein AVV40_gp17 [Mycobacterium phage Swirley]|uniref:Uncharacterized protein n=1 Tax=Mycobacterium phage Swirley TaxID=1527534 RepID=A0A076YPL4_9CAUD|nr:hypothetical protein AVV40_gp17 [Mycobacterium phage Swirley]AIK68942.1 hypothetical protein PBI_SWIRLEY_77 [Mycobacterium phage Swirley]